MPGEDDFDMDSAVEEVSAGLISSNSDGSSADESGLDTTPAVEPPAPTAPAADSAAAPAAPAADEFAEPPTTWRKEATALWAKLDPLVRAEIHKRESDIFRGLETYKSEAEFAKSVKQTFQPYKALMDQYQIDPVKQMQGLMHVHYTLAQASPERRVELFKQLAKDYMVDFGALSASPEDAPFTDPQVKSLQTEILGLKSRLEQQDQQRFEALKETHAKEVAAFAADPKHPYFDELADNIAQLLQKGVATSLSDAYEKAIWVNPSVRQKEIARLATEKAAKDAATASQHAANARRATGANVSVEPKAGSGTAPLGSIDDTLQTTLAAINSRP